MELDDVHRRLLHAVDRHGTADDEAIADELRGGGEPLEADEVHALTAELQRRALLGQPASARDRWQLTDDGRAALRR